MANESEPSIKRPRNMSGERISANSTTWKVVGLRPLGWRNRRIKALPGYRGSLRKHKTVLCTEQGKPDHSCETQRQDISKFLYR
jgi:hypothetical protein